ncbi:MAG: BREX system P-loop protein BrxC [Fusobacteriaceae bacterium]
MTNIQTEVLTIKNTLKHDITRKINGVVKADKSQDKTAITELSEYVVTEEVRRHIAKLFERYVDSLMNPTEDMGIWISGFFGSGKSHFLKMVGHIIENKEYGGKKVTEYFKSKIKDPLLQGNLEKASQKSTDVILFNIDNVSDQDTFQNKDAIVVAFLKKFNEHQGFSRDDIKVAEFERMVSKKEKFEEFKIKFEEEAGTTWEEGRRNIDFNGDEFIDVVEELNILSRENAERWLEKESIKSISAESFCDLLKDYLLTKGKDHRIVFLVDEIGQYIGDNSQLMLNLQTLIELLGVNFQGKVWVGVTSQQDLGAILDSNDRKKNDFSKIQDRFKTMLPLSSGNIDEVIKKRLLEKRQIEGEDLENFYEKRRIDLENLINFEKKGMTLKLYDNKQDFSEAYPFLGYQFSLLQTVFEKVRHMGHSGQHMSRGERSLLSSFQEAGIRVNEKNIGTLVPFNYFYESIEQFLEDKARKPIIHAKNERGVDDFGIEVLKLLFLLKGINGIEPNLGTLTSFMVDSIECDRINLQEKIRKSLSKLEKEVLIQKDGDCYYFLTNEEQDINREIAEESVDQGAVYKALDQYIFEEIYDKNMVTVEETGNKYSFTRRIDELQTVKPGGQLDIVILTPSADNYDKVSFIGCREEYDLIIRLPENNHEYLDEIKYSLKLELYVKKKQRENTREVISQILESKQRENQSRKRRIKNELLRAFAEAETFIDGHKIEIKSKDAGKVIEDSLKASANNRFKNAKLIKKKYDESKIRDILSTEFDSESQIFNLNKDMESNENIEALKELINRIILQEKRSIKTTLKDLVDYFSKKPYGWDTFSVNGIIAELWIYKKINLEESKVLIKNSKDAKEYLTKSQTKNLERITVTLKEEIDRELITKTNNLLKSLWGSVFEIKGESPKEELLKIIDGKKRIIKGFKHDCESKKYPGVKALKNWIELLEEVETLNGKGDKVLKEFLEMEDELLELHEKVDIVEDFFKTAKIHKFDKGVKKLKDIDRLSDYLGEVKNQEAYSRLNEIREMESPYSAIREIDDLVSTLNTAELQIIEKEKETLLYKTDREIEKLKIDLDKREELLAKAQKELNEFKAEIKLINDSAIFTKERKLKNIIQDIEKKHRDLAKAELDVQTESEKNKPIEVKQRVNIRKIVIKTSYNITTESDVQSYINDLEKEVEKLKIKMLEVVRKNRILDID